MLLRSSIERFAPPGALPGRRMSPGVRRALFQGPYMLSTIAAHNPVEVDERNGGEFGVRLVRNMGGNTTDWAEPLLRKPPTSKEYPSELLGEVGNQATLHRAEVVETVARVVKVGTVAAAGTLLFMALSHDATPEEGFGANAPAPTAHEFAMPERFDVLGAPNETILTVD